MSRNTTVLSQEICPKKIKKIYICIFNTPDVDRAALPFLTDFNEENSQKSSVLTK